MKVTEATTMLMVIKAVRLALGALTPWDCRVADTVDPVPSAFGAARRCCLFYSELLKSWFCIFKNAVIEVWEKLP